MPNDFFQNARRVVEKAIGEKMDYSPLDDPLRGKDPAAVKRGRAGGLKGGKNRALKLSPAERREIGRRAATARWTEK
jgi:hypothetical protein